MAITGVSGSGKTSLAMGALYAEGLQRFLQGLIAYSRPACHGLGLLRGAGC